MRNVFLTGFPGFIAGRLVEKLAPRSESITLLSEERFVERARQQAAEVAAAAAVPAERLKVVTGDITRPGLGLDAATAERLEAQLDSVFHLAAIYDLAVPAELAERVNVAGTENVNRFVRRLPQLERYNYVSTYAVAGRRSGVIRESELEHDAGFFNHYEETKHRAEIAVRQLLADGLPVSIYRPGVVVGSSVDGRTAKFDGPYMLLKVLYHLPWPVNRLNFGLPDIRFQVVPVDFIVDAMATLAGRERAVGKTFHLTDPDPRPTSEIAELFCKSLFGSGTYLRTPGFLTRLVTGSGVLEPLGLQREASPYFFHRATFDCVNTLDALEGTGVSVPPLESYVDKLVAFFRQQDGKL
jgi:thioester reductase-like protein